MWTELAQVLLRNWSFFSCKEMLIWLHSFMMFSLLSCFSENVCLLNLCWGCWMCYSTWSVHLVSCLSVEWMFEPSSFSNFITVSILSIHIFILTQNLFACIFEMEWLYWPEKWFKYVPHSQSLQRLLPLSPSSALWLMSWLIKHHGRILVRKSLQIRLKTILDK